MEINLLRRGNLLAIKPLSPALCQLLDAELSYTRLRFMYGEEARQAGKTLDVVPTACYAFRGDKLITNYGFRSKIEDALRKAGYKVLYVDIKPHPRPAVYTPYWERIKHIDLRYRQREVLELVAAEECGRIACPTGYGKSFCVRLTGLLFPKAQIDLVVKSRALCRDAYKELSISLPSVGLIGDGRHQLGRVQVYSADSLHHTTGKADFLFVDEGHELATAKYMPYLARYQYSRNFAFSASHDQRLDKADFELWGVFGPVRLQISNQEGVTHGVIAPIEVYWHDVVMLDNVAEGLSGWQKERDGVARNETRNQIIAEVARRYPEDEQVLITVETIEHAVHLKGLLPEFELCYSVGGMDPKQRDRFIRWGLVDDSEPEMTRERYDGMRACFERGELKKVIATTVWNRGVDFKPLRVLIRADAGGSPINDTQIPGRTSRLHPEKTCGIVHDFRDQFDSSYEEKAKKRSTSYRKMGWKQHFPRAGGHFRQTMLTGGR